MTAALSNMEYTDEQLMEAYQKGDSAVLPLLIRRYFDAIYRYVYRFVRTPAAAEDIVQETFIKVWKYSTRFKAGMTFKPWLYRIAHNTAIDYLRKKQPLSLEDTVEDTIADDTVALLEQSIAREEQERLTAAIESLPEHYRAVILLRNEEGLTFEAIGEVLGKSLNTVKSLYRRGLALLKKNLEVGPQE